MLREGLDEDADRIVLSRGDTCLRAGDVALLSDSRWLNDQLISFFFATLTEHFSDPSVLLVDGSVRAPVECVRAAAPLTACAAQVSFFLANCENEDAAVVTGPLLCGQRSLILLAVNDNPSVTTAGGGSHWTLLAYRRDAGFTHYDSLPGSGNARAAAQVAKTLAFALRLPAERARVQTAPAPKQANGFDCGPHVLLTAQLLCEVHARSPERAPSREELAAHVTPAAATQLRRDMRALIDRLAAEEADKPWDD